MSERDIYGGRPAAGVSPTDSIEEVEKASRENLNRAHETVWQHCPEDWSLEQRLWASRLYDRATWAYSDHPNIDAALTAILDSNGQSSVVQDEGSE